MAPEKRKIIYLKDYSAPDYTVETVALRFELGEETTRVQSCLELAANYDREQGSRPLVLMGEELRLVSVALDGRALDEGEFLVDDESLTIRDVPWEFILEIVTEIRPQENTSLEGLYKSSGNFCTQCEAEGFRKITYFPDRPDVMSRYTTTIVADRVRYPVLLSNGNLVDQGDLNDGRHFAKWHDPFRKPCYLYALVAGDLVKIEDFFVTRSRRKVSLRIYVQEHNAGKCGHAMESLKKAMKWDEEVYGREYDLDTYMIFAADDFNFGAMENKGLNIFNSKYVLARHDTATDADFRAIEEVIGHEYFHNWTGNRITCRDWFQLSLKEGLTIFRDQEFSADMNSRPVKRIADVRLLRTRQFPEDAGPLAHPVMPESFIEINNFYTMTVYYKGAEIVRMIHTLLGPEGFRSGMDLYFDRHDGQAVTVEDFVRAMEDACKADLGQFRLWYTQTGTPHLSAEISHDPADAVLTLTVRQSCPGGQPRADQRPFHLPFAVGLLDESGGDIPLLLEGENPSRASATRLLQVRKQTETFRFINVAAKPVPSLLRGFSAPVKLDYDYTDEQLMFLLAHDSDAFNRWEAGQRLVSATALKLIRHYREDGELSLPDGFIEAFAGFLANTELDRAFVAETMSLPSEVYLAELMEVVDVVAIHAVREFIRKALASALRAEFLSIFKSLASLEEAGGYRIDAAASGARSLKNLCLSYLVALKEQPIIGMCLEQFRLAGNMTDAIGAIAPLVQIDCPERGEALSIFHDRWKDDPLVMDKWFTLQATSTLPGTLADVERLLEHPAFDIRNPNRVKSLIGSFCESNPLRFHEQDGSGYRFLGERIARLNELNPQVAARLLGALSNWRKFDGIRQILMKEELKKILSLPNLAKDIYEIAIKSLKD